MSIEGVLVAQFNIDFQTMVNVPEEMSGFTATLHSRTSITDSTSTLTTTASVQINGYTVTSVDVTMVIGRKTILSSEFKNGNHDHNNIIITNILYVFFNTNGIF